MRVKRGFVSRRRHSSIFKLAKGFKGRRNNCYKLAKDAVHKALQYAYRDRKAKKREFRRLWSIRINAAVTDAGGVLTAFLRMPGAFLHSVDIAIDKAYTAAGFGFATGQWAGILRGDEALRLGMPVRPRNVVFGGGLPMREQGVLIGGIGVSGGSAEQDEICARAGLAALGLEAA